jgi:hypothetical protein
MALSTASTTQVQRPGARSRPRASEIAPTRSLSGFDLTAAPAFFGRTPAGTLRYSEHSDKNGATMLKHAIEELSAPKPPFGKRLPKGADKGVRWAQPKHHQMRGKA